MLIGRDSIVKGKLMIQEKEERIAGIIFLSKQEGVGSRCQGLELAFNKNMDDSSIVGKGKAEHRGI